MRTLAASTVIECFIPAAPERGELLTPDCQFSSSVRQSTACRLSDFALPKSSALEFQCVRRFSSNAGGPDASQQARLFVEMNQPGRR
jgi:hypothetical protein